MIHMKIMWCSAASKTYCCGVFFVLWLTQTNCLISVKQNKLQSLSLRGCPEVDDWFLARLHVFGESLVELDVSHCPCVTVGGLAALQNLR